MSALLIQKIGLLSTQGLNITSAHTAIAQNPAGAGEVLLSVEPPRHMFRSPRNREPTGSKKNPALSRQRHGVSMSIQFLPRK